MKTLWPDRLLLLAFLCSGISGLGLELIWVRVLGLAFGSEAFGIIGVLTGFFAGIALGAAIFHRLILHSSRPARFYIAAEIVIAAYALVCPAFLFLLADRIPRFLGPVVGDNRSLPALALDLAIAMLALLPATVSMGATAAALIEAWQRHRPSRDNENTVAWLYTLNTLGACAGVGLATYWLLPNLGLRISSVILALFSLIAAALVFRWDSVRPAAAIKAQAPSNPKPFLYTLLFLTGFAGIGLEVAGTQVLAQICRNTIHTFANILAVYLAGTALGAWIYAAHLAAQFRSARNRGTCLLLAALTLAGVISAATLSHAFEILNAMAPGGSSYPRTLLAETALAVFVFLLPTLAMGATFSHLVGYFTSVGAGYAAAVNTAGAAIAPFVFGLLLIPRTGYGAAFFAALAMYLFAFAIASLRGRIPSVYAAGFMLAAPLLGAVVYSPLVLVHLPEGSRLLAQKIGFQGVVSVSENGPSRVLQVGQRTLMGGTPSLVTRRMGRLPILLAPAARQVLYLGTGTGITAGSALDYPVDRVTAVELVPEMLDLLPWFADVNHHLDADPRGALHVSDARRFIRATPDSYDVIVADLFHPSRDGTGSLYTVEHFTAIRERLCSPGLFVQWLPLYQLPPRELKTIVRTFLHVFPGANCFLANYSGHARLGLAGWIPQPTVDLAKLQTLLARTNDHVFEGVPDLLAAYMLDAAALDRFSQGADLNTDANQRIVFDAARAAGIEDTASTFDSLAVLLPYRRDFPEDFVSAPDRSALRRDVAPYAAAVTAYLQAELKPPEARASSDYLKAYALDARFTLAAGKVLDFAMASPAAAKDLVERLYQAHPMQPDFARLRERIAGASPDQCIAIISRFIQSGGE